VTSPCVHVFCSSSCWPSEQRGGSSLLWQFICATPLPAHSAFRKLPWQEFCELEAITDAATPRIRTSVIRSANYPDRLGPSSKFVENSTKLTCLEITGYRVHTVNSNSRTSNCQCRLYSKKIPIIRIFCKPGWLTVQINPDKWSSTVFLYVVNNLSATDTVTTFKVDVSQFGNLKDYTE